MLTDEKLLTCIHVGCLRHQNVIGPTCLIALSPSLLSLLSLWCGPLRNNDHRQFHHRRRMVCTGSAMCEVCCYWIDLPPRFCFYARWKGRFIRGKYTSDPNSPDAPNTPDTNTLLQLLGDAYLSCRSLRISWPCTPAYKARPLLADWWDYRL